MCSTYTYAYYLQSVYIHTVHTVHTVCVCIQCRPQIYGFFMVAHENVWLPKILMQARKMVVGSKEIAGTLKKV